MRKMKKFLCVSNMFHEYRYTSAFVPKVLIIDYKKCFTSEETCKSICFNEGCKYWDKKNKRCKNYKSNKRYILNKAKRLIKMAKKNGLDIIEKNKNLLDKKSING